MSKAVKQVLSVAIAVAIPFAAPIIASSAALAGVASTIGMTATSALVGAGLGAAGAAVTGGDVGRGALMGGIGGGVGGYNYTPAATATTAGQSAISSSTGAPMSVAAPTVYDPATGSFVAAAPAAPMSYAPGMEPVVSGSGMLLPQPAGLQATFGGVPTETFASVAGAAPQGSALNIPQAAAAPATAPTFTEAVQQVPGAIAEKFKDPKVLADLTLRAAGQLAGSALAGDGLSAEERALLDEQTAELRTLREQNQALFNQKLEQAQNLIGESKYFDPEYFGLQRARRTQLAGAKAKRAGLRGLEGASRAAESRRFDLATARDVGSAYDQGYLTGVQGRLGTVQAGLSAMPSEYPSSANAYTNLRNAYAYADERRQREVGGLQRLFGSLTETPQASSRGA